MPPHLKLCFAYCGIFPKGRKMIKADLIHLWIALEFVEPSSTFSSWQLGEIYIMQLLKMSFLQHSKADTQLSFQDGCTLFIMHDLVHDLARSVMADEFNLVGPNCRYAWLTDHTKPLKSSITSPVKLRALHIVDHKDDEAVAEFRHDAFSPAKNARVLDLSCYCFKELPTSVGELKQLRYLGAPHIVDGTSLSRISMPRELNYLNLLNCGNLQVFPESICEMKSLMHLDLSSTMRLQELPHSFGKLKAMIYLNLALCHNVKGICEALTELTKLQHLNLAFCQNLRGLQQIIGNLTELRYLNLSGCIPYIFDSPSTNEAEGFIHRICNLACMEELDLSFNQYPLVSIPDNVTILRKLVLVRCLRITSLPECVAKLDNQTLFGLLPQLDVFGVADGNKCTNNLGLLEHVNPDELNIGRLENVWSREEAASIKLSEKVNMRELTLRWSDPSVNALLGDIDILEELVPPSTLHAFAIQGYASDFFPDWLMSIGSYLPNIVRLQLVDFPYCNSLPPITQLPNLRYLTLKNMDSLEEWNTSPFSSGEAAVNELISCKLEQVNIHGCMKLRITPQLPRAASMSIIMESDNVLTSWAESVSQNGASSSSSAAGGPMNLLVEDTEVPLHQWRLLHHVPACSHLHIRSCSDLTSSPEITGALQSFRSLKLEDSESDTSGSLPDWLGELTSLEQLEIQDYLLEEELPDSIRQLKQLESLTLNTCSGLRQLPLWLGELTSLISLLCRRTYMSSRICKN